MARLTLDRSVKFKALVRVLGIPRPFVRGLLETLWDVAHESGNPILGAPDRVEAAAEWPGAPGVLFDALRLGRWLDEVQPGIWEIHDYWHHAPHYVAGRAKREAERAVRGASISAARSAAGRKGAASRWHNDGKREPFANGCHDGKNLTQPVTGTGENGKMMANFSTPNTQHPTPNTPPKDPPVDLPSLAIPLVLATAAFRAAWQDWLVYRKDELRKPLKPGTYQRQLDWLATLGEPVAIETIRASIRNGWQGLFEQGVKSRGAEANRGHLGRASRVEAPPGKYDGIGIVCGNDPAAADTGAETGVPPKPQPEPGPG